MGKLDSLPRSLRIFTQDRNLGLSRVESELTASTWRLSFLYYCLSCCFIALLLCQTHAYSAPPFVELSRRVQLMGTWCTLTTYSQNRQEGHAQLEALIRVLEQTEEELSTWRAESALSRVNRYPVGESFDLNPGLCRLFDELLVWCRATGWAFDPAVGALIDVWGLRSGGRWPSPEEVSIARERSGFRHFDLDEDHCQVARRGPVKIDAGAFGKGEALDRALAHSRGVGLKRWLIDLGGQVMVHGLPPGQDGWPVSVAHPLSRDGAVLTLRLSSGALAVSGGSERDLEVEGMRIGHILDPRSGFPASFEGSVIVWHHRALVADILSTALYVMGAEEGLKWAESRDLATCFLNIGGKHPSSNPPSLEFQATKAFRKQFPVNQWLN